jgi:hypothetical protein
MRTPWWPPSEGDTKDYIETPGLEVLDTADYEGELDSAEYTDEEDEIREQFYAEQRAEYGYSDDSDAEFRDADGWVYRETTRDLIYGYGY